MINIVSINSKSRYRYYDTHNLPAPCCPNIVSSIIPVISYLVQSYEIHSISSVMIPVISWKGWSNSWSAIALAFPTSLDMSFPGLHWFRPGLFGLRILCGLVFQCFGPLLVIVWYCSPGSCLNRRHVFICIQLSFLLVVPVPSSGIGVFTPCISGNCGCLWSLFFFIASTVALCID